MNDDLPVEVYYCDGTIYRVQGDTVTVIGYYDIYEGSYHD